VEVRGACGTYGGEQVCVAGVSGQRQLEVLGTDQRIILKRMLKVGR
jgi:hypothetical protein